MSDFSLRLGADPGAKTSRFRVWAPKRRSVEVAVLELGEEGAQSLRLFPLHRMSGGYFEGEHPLPSGTLYRYRLDEGESFPDPCSRYQPQGPHGPSQIVDPRTFQWSDSNWRGLFAHGQVFYELHVGTFTPEGSFEGVRRELPYLLSLGVTALELMPVASFSGRFNWGYDGTFLYSPFAGYGTPDAFRQLVDEAHQLGIGVVLDVVYNHLGPDGNCLRQYSDAYFSDQYRGEWGDPFNFDGPLSGPVREFFVQNAAYWISEFHVDGLRLDATQGMFDQSPKHVVAEIAETARATARERSILLIAENEHQDPQYLQSISEGGRGQDALWIDDFHHAARVAITGQPETYLSAYQGSALELASCALRNSLFQGQYSAWQHQHRGGPMGKEPAHRSIFFLQNHDQVANSVTGERLHLLAGGARARALTTYFLLLPQTPLLFMGQEFFASTPFLYFIDHPPELAKEVERGRAEFLYRFANIREALGQLRPLEIGESAFRRSKLELWEREKHAPALLLHRELLRLRREDRVFSRQSRDRLSASTFSDSALVLRFEGEGDEGDRLLFLNLGRTIERVSFSDPLIVPLPETHWSPVVNSEEARFGGSGAIWPTQESPWVLHGESACVLKTQRSS